MPNTPTPNNPTPYEVDPYAAFISDTVSCLKAAEAHSNGMAEVEYEQVRVIASVLAALDPDVPATGVSLFPAGQSVMLANGTSITFAGKASDN